MATKDITNTIKALYTELERLSETYEELMDTDVRESLHLTLNFFFVWGNDLNRLPISYGMFTLEGDKAVAGAVAQFLISICSTPELKEVSVGKERLALLQNPEITTSNGCQYDEFIGHMDEPLPPEDLPDDLFDEGDYDD